MAKPKKSSEHHPADGHGAQHAAHGGHAEPEETGEQRQDRESSQRVEQRWARALKMPGAVLGLVLAALSLAWLASLGHSAPSMSWPWLLLLLLALAWSLALARGDREPADEAAPPPHH